MNESIPMQAVTTGLYNHKISDVDVSMQSNTTYDYRETTLYLVSNSTWPQNSTRGEFANPLWATVTIGCVLGFMILATIIGNLLVCIAVGIVRKLRTPSNLLIVSLAVSDLLVAVFVMPLALLTTLKGHWILDKNICDIWVSLDVLFCTASILNLCMISIDRYFAITRPLKYAIKRTPRRMAWMIAIVWTTSAAISISPLFYFKNTFIEDTMCVVSQEIPYQIYATCGAFYLPLMVMIGVYYRIYVVSMRLSASENRSKVLAKHYETHNLLQSANPEVDKNAKQILLKKDNLNGKVLVDTDCRNLTEKQKPRGISRLCCLCFRCECRVNCDSLRNKYLIKKISFHKSHPHHKETKAIKTLGVIMGCFTICWLPFFIIALLRPIICLKGGELCSIPDWLTEICNWLGYANSFLNPVIYARFNRDFRKPFKSILCLKCNKINSRMRSESYVEQYGIDHNIAYNKRSLSTSTTHTTGLLATTRRQNGSTLYDTDVVAKTNTKNSNSIVQYDGSSEKCMMKICEDIF